jgi:hypothetical protein
VLLVSVITGIPCIYPAGILYENVTELPEIILLIVLVDNIIVLLPLNMSTTVVPGDTLLPVTLAPIGIRLISANVTSDNVFMF